MNTSYDIVVGLFKKHEDAQAAVKELHIAGFSDEQIGVAYKNPATPDVEETHTETYAEEGAVAGAATGAGVGALWAVGIASGFLPAIGPAIAGGILGSLLASAATGAAAGALAGSLIGMGVPEDKAEYYENELLEGNVLVAVQTKGGEDEARDILDNHNAYDLETEEVEEADQRA